MPENTQLLQKKTLNLYKNYILILPRNTKFCPKKPFFTNKIINLCQTLPNCSKIYSNLAVQKQKSCQRHSISAQKFCSSIQKTLRINKIFHLNVANLGAILQNLSNNYTKYTKDNTIFTPSSVLI